MILSRSSSGALVRWLVVAMLLALQGCATVANSDPRDPLESLNRGVFGFNDALDRAVIKPVAIVYRDTAPHWLRQGVGNFFGNLADVWSVVNNAIQLRGDDTSDSVGRVMINSTIGIGGFFDVASELGIERRSADFGLTLGRWGVPAGPYVVIPLMGSYTVREVFAYPLDRQGNLVNRISDESVWYGVSALGVVDLRAQYLRAGEVVEGAALDKYSFTRDSYFQRQRNRVYDGNPPDDGAEPEK